MLGTVFIVVAALVVLTLLVRPASWRHGRLPSRLVTVATIAIPLSVLLTTLAPRSMRRQARSAANAPTIAVPSIDSSMHAAVEMAHAPVAFQERPRVPVIIDGGRRPRGHGESAAPDDSPDRSRSRQQDRAETRERQRAAAQRAADERIADEREAAAAEREAISAERWRVWREWAGAEAESWVSLAERIVAGVPRQIIERHWPEMPTLVLPERGADVVIIGRAELSGPLDFGHASEHEMEQMWERTRATARESARDELARHLLTLRDSDDPDFVALRRELKRLSESRARKAAEKLLDKYGVAASDEQTRRNEQGDTVLQHVTRFVIGREPFVAGLREALGRPRSSGQSTIVSTSPPRSSSLLRGAFSAIIMFVVVAASAEVLRRSARRRSAG